MVKLSDVHDVPNLVELDIAPDLVIAEVKQPLIDDNNDAADRPVKGGDRQTCKRRWQKLHVMRYGSCKS